MYGIKGPQIANAILEKTKTRKLTLSDFKNLLQIYSNQKSVILPYIGMYRPMNGIDTSEKDPHIYNEIIIIMILRSFSGERTIFSITVL